MSPRPTRRQSLGRLGLAAVACALRGPAVAQHAASFDLQGHRGARGLAPENTLAGFERALELGVHTLELDTALTADDVVVISHDSALNPDITRDADGRWLERPTSAIRALTLAQLQRLDVGRLRPGTRYAAAFAQQQPRDGERIPSLAQLFERLRERGAGAVRMNIEVKLSPLAPDATASPEAMVRALLAVIDRHGMDARCSVQSFDWRVLALVRAQAPALPLAALTARQSWLDNVGDTRWTAGLALADHGGSVPRLVQAAGAAIWSPYFGDLVAGTLREAHALGLKVVPWTVNAEADIDRLIDAGVDGLITDHPERARAAMARRGMPLPAPIARSATVG